MGGIVTATRFWGVNTGVSVASVGVGALRVGAVEGRGKRKMKN